MRRSTATTGRERRRGPFRMRATTLVLLAGFSLGLVAWLVTSSPFAERPVSKAQIEHAVAKRPRGHVQLVLCNEVSVPSQTPRRNPPQTWTCDTYIGRS